MKASDRKTIHHRIDADLRRRIYVVATLRIESAGGDREAADQAIAWAVRKEIIPNQTDDLLREWVIDQLAAARARRRH